MDITSDIKDTKDVCIRLNVGMVHVHATAKEVKKCIDDLAKAVDLLRHLSENFKYCSVCKENINFNKDRCETCAKTTDK